MTPEQITGRLQFLEEAMRLKDVLRASYTLEGKTESTAEHSWSLCLLILSFADMLGDVDLLKLLKLCTLHDLGEALHGDVPATQQDPAFPKAAQEREDLIAIMAPLPAHLQAEFLSLWDEYEAAATTEARLAKAFDKLETICQHNAGLNGQDFDHSYNLTYGRTHTDRFALTRDIRAVVDARTRQNMAARTPA